MPEQFFERPILNSPYAYPVRHWELDKSGQHHAERSCLREIWDYLKAEINADAWATLRSDTSRPFAKPKGGRIAEKVINHLGDAVMKVFRM